MEVCPEGSPLILGPGLSHFFVQIVQKLGVIAGAAVLDAVQLCALVKFQKFVIGTNPQVVRGRRQNPADVAGDLGRAKMPQHADPFIAFLHVEIAQILIAYDGIGDAGVSQMGSAQADPFGGKFRFAVQQGLEGGGEGSDPPGGFGAHDPLGRDLHQTYFHYRFRRVFRQQFIQHCRVGIAPGGHKILIFFLAGFQRLDVFFCRHLCIHGSLRLFVESWFLFIIIYQNRRIFNRLV